MENKTFEPEVKEEEKKTDLIELKVEKSTIEKNGQTPITIEKEEEDREKEDIFYPAKLLLKLRKTIHEFMFKKLRFFKFLILGSFALIYNGYLIFAIIKSKNIDCCNGVGFLLIITAIVYWSLFYYKILKIQYKKRKIYFADKRPFANLNFKERNFGICFLVLLFIGIIAYIIYDAISSNQKTRLISIFGFTILILLGFLFSKYPSHIKWKQVFGGIFLQLLFALLVLKWEGGFNALQCLSEKIKNFVEFTYSGSDFIYGYLSSGKPNKDLNFEPILVFRALSSLFFIGFSMQILNHLGALKWIVIKLGWLLNISIGTTAVESMSVSANIFLGLADVPLVIKPYLNDLTRSEYVAIMAGGFATVAGSMFAVYIGLGIAASHILSASIMAAPAVLAFSKLVYPERGISSTTFSQVEKMNTKVHQNLLTAASDGAIQSISIISSIVAVIISFIGFIAFCNAIIGWFAILIGFENINLETILGKILFPIAWLIGIDNEEISQMAELLGVKIILTEFVAFQRLGKMNLSPRSTSIMTYALCSFACLPAIGVQLGVLLTLAPKRSDDIVKSVIYSFIIALGANLLNACIAGALISDLGYSEWMQNNFTTIKNFN